MVGYFGIRMKLFVLEGLGRDGSSVVNSNKRVKVLSIIVRNDRKFYA